MLLIVIGRRRFALGFPHDVELARRCHDYKVVLHRICQFDDAVSLHVACGDLVIFLSVHFFMSRRSRIAAVLGRKCSW